MLLIRVYMENRAGCVADFMAFVIGYEEMSTSKYLWLAVDPDEYELPQVVAETSTELARKCGTTKSNVENCCIRQWNGRISGRKFVKVLREEYGEEND